MSPCRQHLLPRSVRTSTRELKQRTGPARNMFKTQRAEQESDSRLNRLILDLKAKIGILQKAMVNHCISVESAPMSEKQKERPAVVKQNGRFAGIAKKKSSSRRTNAFVDPPTKLTDSDNEPQEQAYSMMMIKSKSKKNYSPRPMNKMLVGYTKDAACNREHVVAKERVSSSDK